jgi:hypothetical protein
MYLVPKRPFLARRLSFFSRRASLFFAPHFYENADEAIKQKLWLCFKSSPLSPFLKGSETTAFRLFVRKA